MGVSVKFTGVLEDTYKLAPADKKGVDLPKILIKAFL